MSTGSPSRLLRYFAYGSNLWVARMVHRVPSARFVSAATLRAHRLAFDKRGADGSAKANIRDGESTDRVFGAVFEIAAGDRPALDRFEGAPREYHVFSEVVETPEGSLGVFTYKANPSTLADDLVPFDWYRDFVLHGARALDFPEGYVRAIEQIAVCVDDDAERSSRERRLLLRSLGEPG